MRLKLREDASRDLDEIYDYSLAAHGSDQAERYLRGLWAAMDGLCIYPYSWPVSDLRPGLRSLSVAMHCIFYRIEGDAIVIVRVLHKAMDIGRHL